MEYDIIIVGAGPGGLIAARDAAKKGLHVLVIERRQEIGTPVRCGEGLSESWMKKAGFEPHPSFCPTELHGTIVYSPEGRKFEMKSSVKGYVIERKVMEKRLAADAIRAGAKILVKTEVVDVIKEEDYVKGVKTVGVNGEQEFRGKLIIAADGVESKTAKYAGIKAFIPSSEVDSGFGYEMAGLKFEPKDMIHIWIGNEIAPRGYVWLFPKADDLANVGVGILGFHEKTAKYYLDKFIEGHPEIFKDASVIEMKGGCIPVGKPMEKPYANGLMIIGDAAHQVNPIHGGGMGLAMEAARIAVEVADEAIKANDVSAEFLKKYVDKWFEVRGNQLLQVLKVRKFMEQLTDDDFEKLGDIMTPDMLVDLSEGKKLKAFLKVFIKSPRIAMLAAKTLK